VPTSTPRPAVRACLPGQRLAAQRTRHVCPGAHGGLEAITFAARKENIFVARALIKHGADPRLPIDGGVPPRWPPFPHGVARPPDQKCLVRTFGNGTDAWCASVLNILSTGHAELNRGCATELDARHTKPETDMEKKLKLLRQKVSQDRAKSRGEL